MMEVKVEVKDVDIRVPYKDGTTINLQGFRDQEVAQYIAGLLNLGLMARNLEFEAKKK